MAKFETKDGQGTLWKNNKRTADNQPNAKGDALIDGKWYWVSAWTKRKQDGEPFQSLSFTPKDDRPQGRAKPVDPQAPRDIDDTEIPF